MSLPKVSIIIPTYNGWDHLKQCLPSVNSLDYPKERMDIVVVDNASTDGTTQKIDQEFPFVKTILNNSNLGFAPALNQASKQCDCDYLAFLNNDTKVEPDWLKLLVQSLESEDAKKENRVAACGTILDWEGNLVQFHGGHINFTGKAFHIMPSLEDLENHMEIEPVFYPCGAGMVIRKDVFLESGGFDENYFMIFEDVDLGWRLRVLGYSSVIAKDAIIYHREGASLGELDYSRKALWWERNSLWTIYKNYEEKTLNACWPAALALAAYRDQILLLSGKKEDFEAHHHGILKGSIHIPSSIQKSREFIQSRRKRSDEDLMVFFVEPFRVWAFGESHYKLFSEQGYESFLDECVDRFQLKSIFSLKTNEILSR